MSYLVVDLYTCKVCHSSVKEKHPLLSAQLESIPSIKRYYSTIDFYAPQEDFGFHNPICKGDKVTDIAVESISIDSDFDLFEVVDVQYGMAIDTDGSYLDLHPKIRSVFRGAKQILPEPPPEEPPPVEEPTPNGGEDNGGEDNGG